MWCIFDNSSTIGQKGSENGLVLSDFEHLDGARVTIEKNGDIAPFSVTLGIYGMMCYTYFCDTEEEAIEFREKSIKRIDGIFNLLRVDENNRDENWKSKYDSKISEICEN